MEAPPDGGNWVSYYLDKQHRWMKVEKQLRAEIARLESEEKNAPVSITPASEIGYWLAFLFAVVAVLELLIILAS